MNANQGRKPIIFIGCSVESLKVAKALQAGLDYEADTRIWTQGVLVPSSTAIDDLIQMFNEVDFAIFVFAPDDTANIRGRDHTVTRDNVLIEYGMACQALGKRKVFIVLPRGMENHHFPTDLLGITPCDYDASRPSLRAALGKATTDIEDQVRLLFNPIEDDNKKKSKKLGNDPVEINPNWKGIIRYSPYEVTIRLETTKDVDLKSNFVIRLEPATMFNWKMVPINPSKLTVTASVTYQWSYQTLPSFTDDGGHPYIPLMVNFDHPSPPGFPIEIRITSTESVRLYIRGVYHEIKQSVYKVIAADIVDQTGGAERDLIH